MVRCGTVRRQMEAYLDLELAQAEVPRLLTHLATCKYCFSDYEFLRLLKQMTRKYFKAKILEHQMEPKWPSKAPRRITRFMSKKLFRRSLWVLSVFVACFANQTSVMAEDVFPVLTAQYGIVLNQFVSNGHVDYAALKAQRTELDLFVSSLSDLTEEQYDRMEESERIAFWVNIYNAITLQLIVDHYPIRRRLGLRGFAFPTNSIRQIPGVWEKFKYPILGQERSLNDIEHQVLRKQYHEPRIHMALVCAAKGCPPLRREPYVGHRLDEQVDDQTSKFLKSPKKFRIDREHHTLYLSSIFKWLGRDFVPHYSGEAVQARLSKNERAVVNFLRPFLSSEDEAYLERADYQIKYLKYDATLSDKERERRDRGE